MTGAICPHCKRDMRKTRTCSNRTIEIGGTEYDLIPYGSESPDRRVPDGREYDRCGDCGVKRGGYHHPRCNMEECPRCHDQLISCYCG